MERLLVYLIFSSALFLFHDVSAQTHNRKFYHITRDNELSQNTVNCITKCSHGFMWFGTNDGLNKYDGYRFTYYKHDDKIANSIGLGRINTLYVDSKERLWIGTDQEGLYLYNPLKDNFTGIQCVCDYFNNSNTNVRDLIETSQGYLWVATYDSGLILVDPDSLRIVTAIEGLPDDINSLAYDHGDNLLLGTPEGLYILKNARDAKRDDIPQEIKKFNGLDIISVFVTASGKIWLGTFGSGAFLYDPVNENVTKYSTYSAEGFKLKHDIVRDFSEDHDGNIWIATGGGGIAIADSSGNLIETIQHKLNYEYSINTNIIYCLYHDDVGNVWAGTYNGGTNVLFRAKDKFSHIKSYGGKNDLTNNSVLSIQEFSDGKLYIGTDGGGLCIYDPVLTEFNPLPDQLARNQILANAAIKTLFTDSRGVLWIGTFNKGLIAYNRFTGKTDYYCQDNKALKDNDIWDIAEDRLGNIWVGTLGGGLSVYSPVNGSFRHFLHNTGDPGSISDNVISCLHFDRKGFLWIGTEFGGVCKLTDIDKGIFEVYNRSSENTKINSNQIITLFEDSRGNLWAGTNGGGLNLYKEQENRFINYTEKDGLANNLVFAILEDPSGNLWISTNNGLSKFENGIELPSEPEFQNFSKYDGLQSDEFSPQAACRTSDGILYFGGINGISYFDPGKIVFNDHIPPVVITGLRIFNKPVELNETNNILKEHINLTRELRLKYNQTVITFEFAALDFTMPSQNRYRYKLENFEDQWNDVGNQRSATYTNLDPGTYVFRVTGSNNDKVWNPEGASMKLIISPPFYKTWAFRIAMIITLIIALFFLYWLRNRSLEINKLILRRLVDERTKELLNLNAVLEKKNQEVHDQQEELLMQRENLIAFNEELESNQKKIEAQNEELENHRHNLEDLVLQRTSELEKAKLKAEESDHLKTSFLSNMSHEIRTPLNAIVGFSSLLAEDGLSRVEKVDYLGQINSNTETLLVLIDDILDLAKIESNQLNIVNTGIGVNEFIEELHKTYRFHRNQGVEFRVNNFLRKEDLTIVSDRTRLRQILINLLNNAFKFTDSGFVELGVLREDNLINFYVADTGIGMSEEIKNRIFERFYKIEISKNKVYRGTGLGLTITNKLIELLGGTIKVGSAEGKGSRFDVYIPILPN